MIDQTNALGIPLDTLITLEEAAAQLMISVKTLRNWRSEGIGPASEPPMPNRRVYYRQAELTAWLERFQQRSVA